MAMRVALLFTAVMFAASQSAEAQLIPPSGYPDSATKIASEKSSVGAVRLATSSGGFVWGAVIGGYIGYESLANDCTKCASRQTNSIIGGASIGGAVGAAVGAAFLSLSSQCSFNHRLVRSLIGAGVGASSFFVASGGLDHSGHSAFFVPVGAVGGALGTLGHCWKSRR